MTRTLLAIGFAFALGLAWVASASAQAEHGSRPWELNVNGGVHFLDDADEDGEEEEETDDSEDADFGAGVRVFMHRPSGFGFGGNFTWILSNADFGGGDTDVNAYLYSGEIEYTFAVGTRLHPFVGVGVGAATTKITDAPEGVEDSSTELLIPVAVGIKWFGSSGSWALRADVRDNIIRLSGDDTLGTSDKTTHNIEVSGGISFLFGGM